MFDQAQARITELEQLKMDEINGRAKKMEDKQKLLGIQKEDQSLKYKDKENMRKLSNSVSWENKNILSYLYQPKEHKAKDLYRRNENIYNFYSGQLTQPK